MTLLDKSRCPSAHHPTGRTIRPTCGMNFCHHLRIGANFFGLHFYPSFNAEKREYYLMMIEKWFHWFRIFVCQEPHTRMWSFFCEKNSYLQIPEFLLDFEKAKPNLVVWNTSNYVEPEYSGKFKKNCFPPLLKKRILLETLKYHKLNHATKLLLKMLETRLANSRAIYALE